MYFASNLTFCPSAILMYETNISFLPYQIDGSLWWGFDIHAVGV